MQYLVVHIDKASPVAFPLVKDRILVGRESICDVFLSHPSVSREHARLLFKGDRLYVEDCGSLNGTFVNGKRIKGGKQLAIGDKVVFGHVEATIESAPESRTTITKSLPWAVVDQAGGLGLPEGAESSALAFILKIGEALDCLSDPPALLERFAGMLLQFVSVRWTGFFVFPNSKGGFALENWYEGGRRFNEAADFRKTESYHVDMAMEGTAFIEEDKDAPFGQSARMFVPISGDLGVEGFFICVSSEFGEGTLRLAAVVARLMGLALSRARLIHPTTKGGSDDMAAAVGWIGDSPLSRRVLGLTAKYAIGDSPVVIYGESGTGKELVARLLHRVSDRCKGPFVAFNSSAISPELAASELFGHVKGAFTGATEERKGLLEQSDGGMVFFDEIGDISPALQVKLLRAIETRQIRKVGASSDLQCDFRVICAGNRDLEQLVSEGKFRVDLYYRLSVLTLRVPPLRHRKEDIVPLFEHFLGAAAIRLKRPMPELDEETKSAILAHSWPGNVRELRNAAERAIYEIENGRISPAALGLETPLAPEQKPGVASVATDMSLAIEKLERRMIAEALGACAWNKTRTAERLGITRQTLDRKIFQYDIKPL